MTCMLRRWLWRLLLIIRTYGDYKQPSEEDSSANDEEATEFKNYARQIKRNIRANKLGIHGIVKFWTLEQRI